MKLTSIAFRDEEFIPKNYTSEGEDVSPPLSWSDVPLDCKRFALICEDLDSAKNSDQEYPFVHWLIYNISSTIRSLPEGIDKRERISIPVFADQGTNSFGKIGYGGPMPTLGSGPHRYCFVLYALDSDQGLKPGMNRATLSALIHHHKLATARLTGIFERKTQKKAA